MWHIWATNVASRVFGGDNGGDNSVFEVLVRLGRQELKQLGTVERPRVIYDDELKGFGLRVMPPSPKSPGGTRTWIVEYRPGSGGRGVSKRRLALGRTDTLSPELARQAARNILAEARVGKDPAAQRSQERRSKTVAELGAQYLLESNVFRKPRTAELYRGLWRRYIVPELGATKLSSLRRVNVESLHRKIGLHHHSTANRVVILVSHFFGWAQERELAPNGENPARGIRKFKEESRERYLTERELGALGSAIRQAETVGIEWAPAADNPKAKHAPKDAEARRVRISADAAAALRLLLLTGARLREILHLEWAHVDLERGMLFLPDSKTGRKVIVLGAPALEIISQLASAREAARADAVSQKASPTLSNFVIAGADPERPRADLKRPWALVARRAGLNGVRLHDLRHSYASVGAGAGMGLPLIGRLLGHADPGTTARYAHLDAGPVRRASDLIASSIAASLAGDLAGADSVNE